MTRAIFADINRAGLATLGYDTPDDLIGQVSFEQMFLHGSSYQQLLDDLNGEGFVWDRGVPAPPQGPVWRYVSS